MKYLDMSDIIHEKSALKRLINEKKIEFFNPIGLKADTWQHFSKLKYVSHDVGEGSATKRIDASCWASCKKCGALFKTHDANNKCLGLTSLKAHIVKCIKSATTASCVTPVTNFLYNKKPLRDGLANKLKRAECSYVFSTCSAFRAVEEKGLLNLAQTMVDIGAAHGSVDVKDIWYGRKSVKTHVVESMLPELKEKLRSICEISSEKCEIAVTTDLWTDDVVKRSYLEVTVFWLFDNEWTLMHTCIACEVFPERKDAEIIRQKLRCIFDEYKLCWNDVFVTTDCGANIVCALKEGLRIQCGCHRLSTVVEDSVTALRNTRPDFEMFMKAVHDVTAYVSKCSGIQEKLPKTLKRISGTKPWRSWHRVFSSLAHSYVSLANILDERGEKNRLEYIQQSVFFKSFSDHFDAMECATKPTLQNMLPSYYSLITKMKNQTTDTTLVRDLKANVTEILGKKFWPYIFDIHCLATLLSPRFRDLGFEEETDQVVTRGRAKQALILMSEMVSDRFQEEKILNEDELVDEMPSKRVKNDAFECLDQMACSSSAIQAGPLKKSVVMEFEDYLATDRHTLLSDMADLSDPLSFWRINTRWPQLRKIARCIYVVQCSSGQSERTFSAAGEMLSDKRSLLDPLTVEALVMCDAGWNAGLI
jgi:hypothetical protein